MPWLPCSLVNIVRDRVTGTNVSLAIMYVGTFQLLTLTSYHALFAVSGGVCWYSSVLGGIHLKHDVFMAREMLWRANFTQNRSESRLIHSLRCRISSKGHDVVDSHHVIGCA